MAFTVQDDTGLIEDANAYIDVAYLEDYYTNRNFDLTSLSDEVKEGAIVEATAYIDQRFTYKGSKLNGYTQSTEFPREYLYVTCGANRELVEGIPTEVKKACCEYAYRVTQGTTLVNDGNSNGAVKMTSKKVDVIENTVEYVGGGQTGSFIAYPTADNYLKLFTNASAQGYFTRA